MNKKKYEPDQLIGTSKYWKFQDMSEKEKTELLIKYSEFMKGRRASVNRFYKQPAIQRVYLDHLWTGEFFEIHLA